MPETIFFLGGSHFPFTLAILFNCIEKYMVLSIGITMTDFSLVSVYAILCLTYVSTQ